MTYVIEPSAFGVGYSIFELEIVNGERVMRYLADAGSLREAKALYPNAAKFICPAEERMNQSTKWLASA